MPAKIVTMLAVPEVIVSTPAPSQMAPDRTESKPSQPPRDTDVKLPSPRRAVAPAARRSSGYISVKPE